MSGRRVARLGAALVLSLLGASASAEEWFDAYERGIAALKQKKADRAIESLERAVRLRPDAGTNLITYGTNRLDRYHPYLRLAEAYLLAGQAERAADALKRSAARGREPADERNRLSAEVDAALERARAAAATPPPTTIAAAPPTTLPPVTVAQAPPDATPVPLPAASVPPTTPARAAEAGTGTLELRSEPAGATAFLGDRLLGPTPLKVDLAPGDYTVTLRHASAAAESFPVRVIAGRRTTETRVLHPTTPVPETTTAPAAGAVPAGEMASLVVYSDPPGAALYIDDEPVGATDPQSGRFVKTGVPAGPHRLRATRAGSLDVAQEVTVAPSGPTTVRLTLPAAAVAGPPGWMIAAAVVLLIVVVGLGALRARRPSAEPSETPTATRTLSRATALPTPRPEVTLDVRGPTAVAEATEAGDRETAALPAPPTPPAGAGEVFGEYRLVEPLGKGGMAWVFKAERRGELVALKRPLSAFLEDAEFLERFLREAEIGRTLHHPNIIRIFERGEVARVPYFTMELIKGDTLHAHIRRTGALDAKAATRIIAQVAEALDYAHLKGVIHRDLKPSNIMLLPDGVTVKVMDYGIARARRFDGLTVTGAFLGTPDYVAPETAEGKGTDARSDLYSLGIVFYEILTAQRPFVGDTPFATLRKHVSEPPTPPSVIAPGVPRELEAIVLRLLAKDPADRHPGAEELLIELREFLNRAA